MNAVDFFNELAQKTDGILATGRFFTFTPFLHRRIFNDFNGKIGIKPSDVVLDLGGGTGELTKYVARSCLQVVLADGAAATLHIAKRKLKDANNVIYAIADIDKELPFPKEYFDKIICYSAIHYLSNVGRFNLLFQRLFNI